MVTKLIQDVIDAIEMPKQPSAKALKQSYELKIKLYAWLEDYEEYRKSPFFDEPKKADTVQFSAVQIGISNNQAQIIDVQ